MTAIRTLAALSVAALATACASPGAIDAPPASPGVGTAGASTSVPAMEPRMMAMQDMQQKMTKARTPAERQALMADHMMAMQGGMAMMKEMQGMHVMGGMTGKGDGKGMPADMAQRHQLMAAHMATMQTMMDMMMQRMPPTTPAAQ